MAYKPKLFTPPASAKAGDKPPYVLSDSVLLAIDVALAARRPLLVSGSPGSGKTSLARVIAAALGSRFLSYTVTSRTRLEDLQAEIDMLRRLGDAQSGKPLQPDWAYLKPGILWWAFDPAGAVRRGAGADETVAGLPALKDPSEGKVNSADVVLLLDEIDKADPDLPNDLLEPLDRKRFSLPVQGRDPVNANPDVRVFLIMTTNRERELPAAFLRRCVTLDLPDLKAATADNPGEVTLEAIAAAHFGKESNLAHLYGDIAGEIEKQREDAARQGIRPPSAAEYIDTLNVLRELPDVREPDQVWKQVKDLLLVKRDRPA